MRRFLPLFLIIITLAACRPAPPAATAGTPVDAAVPSATPPRPASTPPPPTPTPDGADETGEPPAPTFPPPTPTPAPTYDAALIEASMVSTRRLELAVPLVYYQAVQATGARCVGDCTKQVLYSLPTDTPRGLIYTPSYPKIDLVPVDPSIPTVPAMGDIYRPYLTRTAADSLYKFIKYVKHKTGRQIYVAHGWRPFYGEDNLGAGASQHQTGLAIDIYLVNGSGVARIDELDGVLDMANQYGWVQTFDFEAPHFTYLDAPAPGLTSALLARGVNPNQNIYHITNALIATYQTLTDSIPPEINDQLEQSAEENEQ